MISLTRHERDVLIILLLTAIIPFSAGFISGVSGYASVTAGAYSGVHSFVFNAAVVYGIYRLLRRGYNHARS